ncbi:rhodanese-like domain-containing protein [Pelomonas sp. KK5]|uniref:rhodanese-like domain-containing protein n=1 Tax=Pelomonas sp. KK5 TaxID=1855730 RepID=UPI00097C88C6|nr:rhodanese-like domain-containing protein [Pelomonas sp. KK5]
MSSLAPSHQEDLTRLPPDAMLLDVRSYAEYMSGHITDAHSLPLSQLEKDVVHKVPDRGSAVILYCSSGARSEQALGVMLHMGYSNVHNGGPAAPLAQHLGRPIRKGL